MRRLLTIFAFLGLLFLVSCGGKTVKVLRANGQAMGTIRVDSQDTFTILDSAGHARAHNRGDAIRDANGKRIGTATVQDTHIILADENQNDIGTLENGADCYGKTQDKLGKIVGQIDPQAAGAACLVLLLPQETNAGSRSSQ